MEYIFDGTIEYRCHNLDINKEVVNEEKCIVIFREEASEEQILEAISVDFANICMYKLIHDTHVQDILRRRMLKFLNGTHVINIFDRPYFCKPSPDMETLKGMHVWSFNDYDSNGNGLVDGTITVRFTVKPFKKD